MLGVNLRYGEFGKEKVDQNILILLYSVMHYYIHLNDSV
jgi:hypothetical protein